MVSVLNLDGTLNLTVPNRALYQAELRPERNHTELDRLWSMPGEERGRDAKEYRRRQAWSRTIRGIRLSAPRDSA